MSSASKTLYIVYIANITFNRTNCNWFERSLIDIQRRTNKQKTTVELCSTSEAKSMVIEAKYTIVELIGSGSIDLQWSNINPCMTKYVPNDLH